MKKIILTFFIFTLSVFATSSVWKVTNGKNVVYFGGTIHIFTKGDLVPREYKTAYDKSDILYFETDIEKINDPSIMSSIDKQLRYKDKKITDFLDKETSSRLKSYFTKKGLPFTVFETYKPGMIMMLFSIFELQALGETQDGLDSRIEKWAKKDGKKTTYFESVEEQIGFIAKLGIGNEQKFIKFNLDELKNFERDFAIVKEAWLFGDINTLDEKGIKLYKKQLPKFYDTLLVKRNNAWMKTIKKMFSSKEVEFVLVGALHFAGENGILTQLKKLGYKIEQIK